MAEEVKLEILAGTGIFTFQNETIYTGHIYFFICIFFIFVQEEEKSNRHKKNLHRTIKRVSRQKSKKLQLIYKYFPKYA
jgi:hypothetical protein